MATQTMEQSRTEVVIRPATDADFPAVYALFQHILEEGATYAYSLEEMTEERSRDYWMTAQGTHCYVAELNSQFAGVFAIRPNRTGHAAHVANASFLVHQDHRGKGIGKALGRKALELAKSLGYQSIQYNFVVSVNDVAVKLWKSLGFAIIGTMPKGFKHPKLGLIDVYMMHKELV